MSKIAKPATKTMNLHILGALYLVSSKKLRYNFASGSTPFDGAGTHKTPHAMVLTWALIPPAFPACAMHHIFAGTVARDHYILRTQGSHSFIIELFETDYTRLD